MIFIKKDSAIRSRYGCLLALHNKNKVGVAPC